MPKCAVCVSPDRVSIETDRSSGVTLKQLEIKYPAFSQRQLQRHLDLHWHAPRGETDPADLKRRLDILVERCESLVAGCDDAPLGERTKAIHTLNQVMRTALQTAGLLKSLAPAVSKNNGKLEDFPEFRIFLSKLVKILEKYPGAAQEVLSCIGS